MSWDKYAAVTFARQHAGQQSTHYCARAVAKAIRAGGVSIAGANANNFEHSLIQAGFHQVYGEPALGDVAVIAPLPGAHQYGHVCIYDGHGIWYSDFVQHYGMYPGPAYRSIRPAFKLYRH